MCPNEGSSSHIGTNINPIAQNIFVKGKDRSENKFASGIGISIIPPGVSDEYPDVYSSETTFGDSSLLVLCENTGNTGSNPYASSLGGCEQKLFGLSGLPVISYAILVDQYTITLFGGYGSTARGPMKPIFTIGKVLGTLSYDTEIAIQSYASVRYVSIRGGSVSENDFDISQDPTNAPSTSKVYYGAYSNYNSSYPSDFDYSTQCFRQDGTRIESCYYGISNGEMLSARITNSQSPDFIRWVPGIMFDSYSDTPIYEGGDGFKGYLDTNLIRYAIANKGQLFNNGQFCCVADNLLLKWDPDATDTILA
jgi:hypothetical protein